MKPGTMTTNHARAVYRWAATVVLLIGVAGCAGSQTEAAAPAAPTWEDRTLRATGRGAYPEGVAAAQARLMAERAARTDAYRKLTEQVYGVEIRSGTTVRDALLADDRIQTRFEGFIRGARVIDTRRRSDIGLVEIDMEVTLDESFSGLFGGR
jgi:hypothetical protein